MTRWSRVTLRASLSRIQVHNYIRSSAKDAWTLVGAAIINGGGIRSSVDEHYGNGGNQNLFPFWPGRVT